MNDSQDVNTKDALLAAAIEVFADKGFDSATVRDICSRANANVAAVNYHYGSKDGLYTAVLKEVFPRDDNWQIETTADGAPEEQLREFLTGLGAEIFQRHNGLIGQRWAIFLREMAKPSDNLGYIAKNVIQPRADLLRKILSEILGPETSDITLAYCSTNVWALMLDHLLTQPILDRLTPHRPNPRDDIERFVDHVVKFSLGGLMAVKGQ